jgi:hypothetical protein
VWRERLKTGLIVVLLTGLIWFFADQADLDSKTVSLHLGIQPPGAGYIVMAQEPEVLELSVTFRAPRGVIREIEQELRTRLLNATFVPDKPAGDARFVHLTFESMKVVPQLDEIRQRGLTIVSVRPATFSVDLDTMVRRPMRIKPEFGELVVDEPREEPRPATVDVIMPSTMADELSGDTLPVDVTSYADTSLPDKAQRKTVELRWRRNDPRAKFVHFEPASFDIRFRLKDTAARRTLTSVPVSFSATPEVLSRYTPIAVDKAEFLQDITVAGPRQIVDSLSPGDISLIVQVYGSDEANIGQTITRQIKQFLQIKLQPHVQIISQPRDIRFTLQERKGPNGTG